jgi:hypothetical protein
MTGGHLGAHANSFSQSSAKVMTNMEVAMTAIPNTAASVHGSVPITFRQFMVSVYCTHGSQRSSSPCHTDIGRTSVLDVVRPGTPNSVESVIITLGRLACRRDFGQPVSAAEVIGMLALAGQYGDERGISSEETTVVYDLWAQYECALESIERDERPAA